MLPPKIKSIVKNAYILHIIGRPVTIGLNGLN
jgi:hypothetical protein